MAPNLPQQVNIYLNQTLDRPLFISRTKVLISGFFLLLSGKNHENHLGKYSGFSGLMPNFTGGLP